MTPAKKGIGVECTCSDEQEWTRCINGRKQLQLPAHHQIDWDEFQTNRTKIKNMTNYPIYDSQIIVDTVSPLNEIVSEIKQWLDYEQ